MTKPAKANKINDNDLMRVPVPVLPFSLPVKEWRLSIEPASRPE
jgi:hypothetical protein